MGLRPAKFTALESNTRLHEIAMKILQYWSPQWHYPTRNTEGGLSSRAYLRHDLGMELSLSFDLHYAPKRLIIRGQYPNYSDGRPFYFGSFEPIAKIYKNEISVAWDADPKAIAQEIERCLLPDYQKRLEEARRRIALSDKARGRSGKPQLIVTDSPSRKTT